MEQFVKPDGNLLPIDTGKTVITPIQSDTGVSTGDLGSTITRSEGSPSSGSGTSPNSLNSGINLLGVGTGDGTASSAGNNSPEGNDSPTPGTEHYTGYDSIADRIRRILGDTVIDNLLLGWTPDSNLSPEENLKALSSWLDSLFLLYSFQPWKGSSLNFADQPFNYASILQMVYKSLSNTGPLIDLSDSATIELAEKIADMSYSYINEQFNAALSYQSWYLQQEYNSPINQINRLAEAGLASAFIFGNFNAGNASQPASMPMIQNPSMSNAGQAQAAAEANENSLFGSIFGSVAGFIPSMLGESGSFFRNIAEGEATNKLTPYRIADLGASAVSNGAVAERARAEADSIRQNMAFNLLDKEISFGQSALQSAGESLDSALMSYQTDWNNYTQEYTDTAWQCQVVDKSGKVMNYTLTKSELEDAINRNGKTSEGYTVVGSESWEKALAASIQVGTDVDIPLVGGASVNGSLSSSDKTSGSSSNSKERASENGFSINTKNGTSLVGYSEDGKSFRIGNTKFTSVTTRKRIPLPEYAAQIKRKYEQYQKAVDHYNTLSVGQQARCLRLLDELTQNLGKFSAGVVSASFSSRIKDLFKPKEIIAD